MYYAVIPVIVIVAVTKKIMIIIKLKMKKVYMSGFMLGEVVGGRVSPTRWVEPGDRLHPPKRGGFPQACTPHVIGELPLLVLFRISMHFPHERHPQTFGQHPEWAGFQSMCQGLEWDRIGLYELFCKVSCMKISLWPVGVKESLVT